MSMKIDQICGWFVLWGFAIPFMIWFVLIGTIYDIYYFFKDF